MKMTRRRFWQGLVTPLIAKTMPRMFAASALLPSLTIQAKSEPITIALTIAALLAKTISEANKGDGGLSNLASADHALLKIALDKLDHIEGLLIEVYQQIALLTEAFDQILTRHEVQDLRDKLSSIVLGYRELIESKLPGEKESEWMARALTQQKIQFLYSRLTEARQLASVKKMFDPYTALMVGQLAMVENGLLNLSNAPHAEIAKTLKESYLGWLDSIVDPSIVGSTTQYILTASQRHSQLSATASKSPLGAQFEFPSIEPVGGRSFDPDESRHIYFGCSGVNDFKPGIAGGCSGGGVGGGHGGGIGPRVSVLTSEGKQIPSDEYKTIFGESNPSTETVLKNAKRLGDIGLIVGCFPGIPDHRGEKDRLTRQAFLTLVEQKTPSGQPTGVMLWQLTEGAETNFASGKPGMPTVCEVTNEDAPDKAARLIRIKQFSAFSEGEKQFVALSSLVDKINVERARFAFGLQALAVSQGARESIERVIKAYG